jgi:hypothetical protein
MQESSSNLSKHTVLLLHLVWRTEPIECIISQKTNQHNTWISLSRSANFKISVNIL